MSKLKSVLRRITPLSDLARCLRRHYFRVRLGGKDCEQVFSTIYRENYWGGRDSVSGTGSAAAQTGAIIRELPKLLEELRAASILDIPCGDFHWMDKLEWRGVAYTGADIVAEIIENNRKHHEKSGISFLKLDLIGDELPRVDLVFCRDCLVHFSFADVFKALRNICRSESKYLLTTTFPERKKNHDIVTGQWRVLNLEKPPFNLPRPLKIITEECTEEQGAYADKSLALWKIDEMRKILPERFPE